jgi:hypothetical protein
LWSLSRPDFWLPAFIESLRILDDPSSRYYGRSLRLGEVFTDRLNGSTQHCHHVASADFILSKLLEFGEQWLTITRLEN